MPKWDLIIECPFLKHPFPMPEAKGKVISVNESLVGTQTTEGAVMNGEVAYIIVEDGKRLKAEVIDIKEGNKVYLQVFEDSSWMRVGDPVEYTGLPLSVKLGPGILGSVTDGLQNPLYELGKIEWFLEGWQQRLWPPVSII